jgi:hypothetical protein
VTTVWVLLAVGAVVVLAFAGLIGALFVLRWIALGLGDLFGVDALWAFLGEVILLIVGINVGLLLLEKRGRR